MIKELDTLARILKKAGYKEHANKVMSIKIKVDPLTFAVSQGLLNPSVLSILDEEGHEEDMSDFIELLDELKGEKEEEEEEEEEEKEEKEEEER